jgi:hypothetical protein
VNKGNDFADLQEEVPEIKTEKELGPTHRRLKTNETSLIAANNKGFENDDEVIIEANDLRPRPISRAAPR